MTGRGRLMMARTPGICRCDGNFLVTTRQEHEGSTHQIILECTDCGRQYGIADSFGGELLPPREVVRLWLMAERTSRDVGG